MSDDQSLTPGLAATPKAQVRTAFPSLLTLKQVVARIGCSARWLNGHLLKFPYHQGRPTYRRIGRRFAFTEDDFQRLLATMEPGEDARRLAERFATPRVRMMTKAPPVAKKGEARRLLEVIVEAGGPKKRRK